MTPNGLRAKISQAWARHHESKEFLDDLEAKARELEKELADRFKPIIEEYQDGNTTASEFLGLLAVEAERE